ncbi:hypothetical protein [Morganella morganii]|uniref:hypothetical protein n=1 Tax=Morganella morganii TaxID=582 RepID=UPI0012999951|nr:hypothetical protein [Morganella morganii]MRE59081.1 hypothetical protein [Morganella morganii]HDU8646358.1 hypothetical protein [Morganella morganii subsp. morganii]
MNKMTFSLLLLFPFLSVQAAPAAFDINKKQEKINFVTVATPVCQDARRYDPPLPKDPDAGLYYRAANKIKGQRDTANFRNMYILARKSADMGHWKAKLLMADLYLQKTPNYYYEFKPDQARAYIDELMSQNIPVAFYEMSKNRSAGYGSFKTSPAPASFYLYRAAELGNPDAMVSISNIFLIVKRHKESRALLECGFKYGGGGSAANGLAISESLNARTQEDWIRAFYYLYAGAKAGDRESMAEMQMQEAEYQQKNPGRYYLNGEFVRRAQVLSLAMNPQFHHDDPYRKAKGLPYRVKGNIELKFPDLEKIIPLPPATLPPWNEDITAGMSTQDAADYRTDFDYDRLVAKVQLTGLTTK